MNFLSEITRLFIPNYFKKYKWVKFSKEILLLLLQKSNCEKNHIFFPNALMIPERHFMISLIQNYLDKKNKVTILTCGGTKGFSCSLNVLGNRQLCKSCISIRNNSISKLKGSFKVIEIKEKKPFPLKYKKNKSLN